MNNRIRYLDWAKGLAIIFVIFGHVVTKKIFFRNWFYSFHLPLFFIISGILIAVKLQNKNIKDFDIKKKIINIMKPYFITSVFITIILYFENLLKITVVKETFFDNIRNMLVFLGVKATWYLPCLAICLLLFYFLIKHINSKEKVLFISLCLFLMPFLFSNIDIDGIKILFRSFVGLFFLCIGYYGKDYIEDVKPSIFIIIILLIINIFSSYFMGSVDLWSLKMAEPVLYLTSAVSGTLAIIFVFKRLSETKLKLKLLNFIGQNSLLYFSTHIVFIYLIKFIYLKIFTSELFLKEIVYGSIITIIVVLVELPFIYGINRIKLKWGKRKYANDKLQL